MSRIFQIGMNKAGTYSLCKALQQLGIPATHAEPELDQIMQANIQAGRAPLEGIDDKCLAWTDYWLMQEKFELFDQAYPGSKFIFTVRELQDWLDSREHHVRCLADLKDRGLTTSNWTKVDRESWKAEYLSQVDRVWKYFGDRPDLLVFDVFAGDGYPQLCKFLGFELVDLEFPRLNTRQDVTGAYEFTLGKRDCMPPGCPGL